MDYSGPMRRWATSLGLAIATLTLSGLAHGQAVVYFSGAPNQNTAWYADASDPSAVQAAAPFTLSGAATVDQLSWWGGYTQLGAASAADRFALNIYSNSGGHVGSLIASVALGNAGEAATGLLIQNSPEYAYGASFAGIALGAGSYFLGLERVAGNGVGIWGWESAGASAQSVEAYQSGAGVWSYNPGANVAVSLGGTLAAVPEASAAALTVAGLALIAALPVLRRRIVATART